MRLLLILITLAGLATAVASFIHEGAWQVFAVFGFGGWYVLLLVPLHVAAIALDAQGWHRLLSGHVRPRLPFLTWAALIRESIDGLLPVARVGGGVAGMDLLCSQGVALPVSAASVVAELTVTLIAQAIFVLVGFAVLAVNETRVSWIGWVVVGCMVLSIPFVLVLMYFQRHTRVFRRVGKIMRHLFRARLAAVEKVERIDVELSKLFGRYDILGISCFWQVSGLLLTAVEVWFALRVMGHPVSLGNAVVIESLGQALRSIAFIVPAALGVQEVGLIAFGTLVGLAPDVSLALSLAKRVRDLLIGLPSILSWLWFQAKHLRHYNQ